MNIYEFDMKQEDFYNNELCNKVSQDLEEQIKIRSIALELLQNWNGYREPGTEILKEFLFSITELGDYFYIRIDKQEEFVELLTQSHKYFHKNKEKYGYGNISYNICGKIYFCLPNLLNKNWPLLERIITLSIYYNEQK